MAIRPIVQLGDPRLRVVGAPIDSFGKSLHDLLDEMTEVMRKAPGVGLAAQQIGEALQVCVIEVDGQLHELINPRILKATGDQTDLEGCLSLTGYYAYVTRRNHVVAQAQNRFGRKIRLAGEGLLARAIQHELDHLDGKLYIDLLGSMDELIPPGGLADSDETDEAVEPRSQRTVVTAGPPIRRARIVFIGTGPFGVEALHALASRGPLDPFELVGVVTTPGRPAGRKGEIRPSPIEAAARDLDIVPILALPRLRPPAAVAAVLALEPDLVVLADDGRIVPRGLLDTPSGALNLHPSLLPRHRGATPIPSTILAGDTETGVTMIRMDDGIDTGPIVAVERIPLDGTETAPVLEDRLAKVAADLLMRTIGPWLRGEVIPVVPGRDGRHPDAPAPP